MNKPVDRLSNTLHSVGASFIGVLFAIFISFVTIVIPYINGLLLLNNHDCIFIFFSFLLAIVFFILHLISFKRVIENIKNMVETTLSTVITRKYKVIIPQSVLKNIA
jgi:hypothetical protein